MADNKLSEFQRKKILRVFNILYDSNKDGVIEKEDFEISIEKICSIMDWKKEHDRHRDTRNTLELIWTGLQEYADSNDDKKVSKDEWLKMWEDCIQSDELPEWQKKFMKFMFDVNDKSCDDEIDEEEYCHFYQNYCSITEDECKEAFLKLNGGKNITRDGFKQLWKDYFVSNDKEAKGNYLFGVPDFLKVFQESL